MRHQILIVSNPSIPDISEYFAAEVYDVELATSLESMVAFLAAQSPAVVIVDIKSAEIDIEEVRHLVSSPNQTEIIPLIWLLESDAESLDYGFQYPMRIDGYSPRDEDYTIIPCDTMELELRARNAINRSQRGK